MNKWINRQEDNNLQIPRADFVLGTKYYISVGRIIVDGKAKGMGFLLRKEYGPKLGVYCITTKHIFVDENNKEGIIKEIISKASIFMEPLYQNGIIRQYKLEPILSSPYLDKPYKFDAPPIEQIVVFRVHSIPCNVINHIFGISDLVDSNDTNNNNGVRLHSYGFPQKSSIPSERTNGTTLDYEKYRDSQDKIVFSAINVSKQSNANSINEFFNGFSGTPIIDQEKSCIYAMHEANSGVLIDGIKSVAIKKYLIEMQEGKE